MKITIAQGAFFPVPTLEGGAVEKRWFTVGQEFAKQGHQVTHISKQHPDLPDHEFIEGVEHIRVKGYQQPSSIWQLKFFDLLYSLRVRKALPLADILIVNTFFLPFLAKASAGKIVINQARFPKGQSKFFRPQKHLIHAVSHPIKAQVISENPALADNTFVVNNPVPFPLPTEISQPKEKILLYTGRIHPEKGVLELAKAFAAWQAENQSEWSLCIMGPSDTQHGGGGNSYMEKIKSIAQTCASIHLLAPSFHDTDQALHEEYKKASIFVYPSLAIKGESFGLAPLEAMSYGCPSILTDLECFQEYAIADKNAWFVPAHRDSLVNSLQKKFDQLLADDRDLSSFQKNAFQTAQRFSSKTIASQLLEKFEYYLQDIHLLK